MWRKPLFYKKLNKVYEEITMKNKGADLCRENHGTGLSYLKKIVRFILTNMK